MMDASHDVIAVSSMAGVGRGSSVTNRDVQDATG